MSSPGPEFVEIFLQEASEHLQFLREYSPILQDPYPGADDVERLYISAHGLAGTSATYGYKQFSEVASKLAHIFQYAMNATISPDASGPLVEFITEGVAVLETDLLMISSGGAEAEEDIAAFKARYPFAFQAASTAQQADEVEPQHEQEAEAVVEELGGSDPLSLDEPAPRRSVPTVAPIPQIPDLPADGEAPAEVMEFFVPEAEEHL